MIGLTALRMGAVPRISGLALNPCRRTLSPTVTDTKVPHEARPLAQLVESQGKDDRGEAAGAEPADERHCRGTKMSPVEGEADGEHPEHGQTQHRVENAASGSRARQARPEHGGAEANQTTQARLAPNLR